MILRHCGRHAGVRTTNLSDHPHTIPLPHIGSTFEGAFLVNTLDYESFRIRLINRIIKITSDVKLPNGYKHPSLLLNSIPSNPLSTQSGSVVSNIEVSSSCKYVGFLMCNGGLYRSNILC